MKNSRFVRITALIVAMFLLGAIGVLAVVQVGTVQSVSTTAITPTFATITNTAGIYFTNNGASLLYVKNDALATVYMTVTTPATFGGLALADNTFTMTAGAEAVVGPFNPNYYNVTSGTYKGQTNIAASDIASVTVAFFSYE